ATECGLADAAVIAWSDYETDRYDGSDPGATAKELFEPSKIVNRRISHFPIDVPGNGRVIRDSAAAQAAIKDALQARVADPISFAIGLHVFQDSWSHEGFTPRWGHLIEGQKPDFPYHDVPRALEMEQASWGMLEAWSRKTTGHGCVKTWPEIETHLKVLD